VDCISFNIFMIGFITRFSTKLGSYKKSFTFLSLCEKLVPSLQASKGLLPFVVSLSLVSTCLVFLCVLGFVSNTQSERGNDEKAYPIFYYTTHNHRNRVHITTHLMYI
jgi:hypothetical protein